MIYTLQYLRALAVTLVVLSHLHFKSSVAGADVLAGFRIGAAGVDVFFVISGFVMAMIYARTPNGPGVGWDFWLRRLARIVPMYWLVTSVALVLYLVSPALVNANGGPTSIWRSYLLVPTLYETPVQFLIGPGWSLSFELFFYLICTAAFFAPSRMVGQVGIAAVLLALSLGTLTGLAPTFLLTSPILLEFAFGMAIHAWFVRHDGRLPVVAGTLSMVAGVVGFVLLNLPGAFDMHERWWRAGVPAAALVAGTLAFEPLLRNRPWRLGMAVGNASYSLYLTHVFVLGAASRGFGMLHLRGHGPAVELAFWLCTLAASVFAGWLAYRFVEHPLTRWFTARIKRRDGVNDPSRRLTAVERQVSVCPTASPFSPS